MTTAHYGYRSLVLPLDYSCMVRPLLEAVDGPMPRAQAIQLGKSVHSAVMAAQSGRQPMPRGYVMKLSIGVSPLTLVLVSSVPCVVASQRPPNAPPAFGGRLLRCRVQAAAKRTRVPLLPAVTATRPESAKSCKTRFNCAALMPTAWPRVR